MNRFHICFNTKNRKVFIAHRLSNQSIEFIDKHGMTLIMPSDTKPEPHIKKITISFNNEDDMRRGMIYAVAQLATAEQHFDQELSEYFN